MMSFRPKKKSGMEHVVSVPPKAKGKDFCAVLSFPLFHGDITIMHGSRIHGLYEVSSVSLIPSTERTLTLSQHQVEPAGGRRFALTCRYMDPAKMKTDEERLQAKIGGALPARANKYIYHGDGHLITEGVLKQDTVTQDTAIQHHNEQEAGNQDIASLGTLTQGTVLDGQFQDHSIQKTDETAHTNDRTEKDIGNHHADQQSATVQSTLERYNFRSRKTAVNYKDEDAFPTL